MNAVVFEEQYCGSTWLSREEVVSVGLAAHCVLPMWCVLDQYHRSELKLHRTDRILTAVGTVPLVADVDVIEDFQVVQLRPERPEMIERDIAVETEHKIFQRL